MRAALEPRHGAAPVETVRAGEVHKDIACLELVEANRTVLLIQRLPAQLRPAEPPTSGLLRVHLPLHVASDRRTRCLSMITSASHAVVPLNLCGSLAPQLLVQSLLRLPCKIPELGAVGSIAQSTPLQGEGAESSSEMRVVGRGVETEGGSPGAGALRIGRAAEMHPASPSALDAGEHASHDRAPS